MGQMLHFDKETTLYKLTPACSPTIRPLSGLTVPTQQWVLNLELAINSHFGMPKPMSQSVQQNNLSSGSPSSPGSQYGSVLLDCALGTAHWSPEAPRRALTPDSQARLLSFPGRARHCKSPRCSPPPGTSLARYTPTLSCSPGAQHCLARYLARCFVVLALCPQTGHLAEWCIGQVPGTLCLVSLVPDTGCSIIVILLRFLEL